MSKSKVYFSKILSPERVIDLYNAVGVKLDGNIGVKVHSGEQGNQNYLRPEFLAPMINSLMALLLNVTLLILAQETQAKSIRDYLKNMDGINISLLI